MKRYLIVIFIICVQSAFAQENILKQKQANKDIHICKSKSYCLETIKIKIYKFPVAVFDSQKHPTFINICGRSGYRKPKQKKVLLIDDNVFTGLSSSEENYSKIDNYRNLEFTL